MDRFDFMKRLQDQIGEVRSKIEEVDLEIQYHEARSAKALGLVDDPERGQYTTVMTFQSSNQAGVTVHFDAPAPTDEMLDRLALELADARIELNKRKEKLEKAKRENIVDKIKRLMNATP